MAGCFVKVENVRSLGSFGWSCVWLVYWHYGARLGRVEKVLVEKMRVGVRYQQLQQ